MPYSSERKGLLIPKEYDRRRKLTEHHHELIRAWHAGGMSQREIVRTLEDEHNITISRRSVQFILDPEKLRIQREQFRARRKDGLYKPTPESWAQTMREHRAYRHQLQKNNKLIDINQPKNNKK